MEQLEKAKSLAMENNPAETLPKVLDTSASLYASTSVHNTVSRNNLARFFGQLMVDVIAHGEISKINKPLLASQHLDTMWSICSTTTDIVAYKYSILSFTACYPYLFEIVAKTSDSEMWNTMRQYKNFIVSRWRTTYPIEPSSLDDSNGLIEDETKNMGCKMATAKFLSQLVIIHTSASKNSPPDSLSHEINIGTVPDRHPVITDKKEIETEGKRYLDYLLNYLIEQPLMIGPLFIAILNCLTFIMKQRPQATVRIISALLRFNVDAKFQPDNEPTLDFRLSKRFVERCYKNFVQFGMKSQLINKNGSIGQFYHKLAKISQTLHVIGEETKSKGILSMESIYTERKMSETDRNKFAAGLKNQQLNIRTRVEEPQKLRDSMHSSTSATPVPSAPSIAQVPPTLPQPLVKPKVSNNTIPCNSPATSANPGVDNVDEWLTKLESYTRSKSDVKNFANSSTALEDTTYAAIFNLMNKTSSGFDISKIPADTLVKICSESFIQIDTTRLIAGLSIVASRYTTLMNQSTSLKRKMNESEMALQTKKVKLQANKALAEDENHNANQITAKSDTFVWKPRKMSSEEKKKHLQSIVKRLLNLRNTEEHAEIAQSIGNDLRPLHRIKLLQWNNEQSWLDVLMRLGIRGISENQDMADFVRETLYAYMMEDVHSRAGVLLEWLNEEWYYERLILENKEKSQETSNYMKWSVKILQELIPSLENQHRRLFIRLMSELPELSNDHINTIRSICMDPARSTLGFQTLKFLLMFRPPVKPSILEFLVKIKQDDPSTATQCDALLSKFFS